MSSSPSRYGRCPAPDPPGAPSDLSGRFEWRRHVGDTPSAPTTFRHSRLRLLAGRPRTSSRRAQSRDHGVVFVGAVEIELLLGDVRSLKHKRAVVRPLLAELRRRYDVAAAETGDQDLWRRAAIGVATVSGTTEHVHRVCDEVERWAWSRPEVDVVQVTRWVRSIDD